MWTQKSRENGLIEDKYIREKNNYILCMCIYIDIYIHIYKPELHPEQRNETQARIRHMQMANIYTYTYTNQSYILSNAMGRSEDSSHANENVLFHKLVK